ncbi:MULTISPECIES: helix-turn-helix domain-containing protein [unclassified Thiocapsa]|uniref:helix-turn-helix domain-containing protein n=1 Tax=unclassified Thiocapsa TaxID=2641286 RepID=UPI0035AFE783
MTQAIPSASASSAPIKSYEKVVGQPGTAVETSSNARCQIYTFEDYAVPKAKAPARHVTIGDLVECWEQNPEKRAAIEEGRHWVAETFYPGDGDTVRTLRLRKGWSQTRLAEALGTSQSHVARIERGTENLAIQTCRKLAAALDIDLNTLDQALNRQEAIVRAKQP